MKKEYLTKKIRSDKDKVLIYMKTAILMINKYPEKFKSNKYAKKIIKNISQQK